MNKAEALKHAKRAVQILKREAIASARKTGDSRHHHHGQGRHVTEPEEDITLGEFLGNLSRQERAAVVALVRDLRSPLLSPGDYDAPWQVALRRAHRAAVCIDEDCGLSGGRAHVGPCEKCPCPMEHAVEECPEVRGQEASCSHTYLMRTGTGLRCQTCESPVELPPPDGQPTAILARDDGSALIMERGKTIEVPPREGVEECGDE